MLRLPCLRTRTHHVGRQLSSGLHIVGQEVLPAVRNASEVRPQHSQERLHAAERRAVACPWGWVSGTAAAHAHSWPPGAVLHAVSAPVCSPPAASSWRQKQLLRHAARLEGWPGRQRPRRAAARSQPPWPCSARHGEPVAAARWAVLPHATSTPDWMRAPLLDALFDHTSAVSQSRLASTRGCRHARPAPHRSARPRRQCRTRPAAHAHAHMQRIRGVAGSFVGVGRVG
jgi:hypothetical protein